MLIMKIPGAGPASPLRVIMGALMLIMKNIDPRRRAGVPPPHQLSPGSAGVPPASIPYRRFRPCQRHRARVQTGNILYTINRKQGLHLARVLGKEPCASLKNHSPLEGGVGETRAEPAVEPVGGKRRAP